MQQPQRLVISSKVPDMTGRVRSHVIGRSLASDHTPASASPYVSLTGRTLPASGAFRPSILSVDRRLRLRDQLVFTSNFFTLAPMCQPQEFASGAIENRHSCKHHLLCRCANTTKCTPPCVCVLAFHNHFPKDVSTQLATPLDPSDDAKLDHSSGTR